MDGKRALRLQDVAEGATEDDSFQDFIDKTKGPSAELGNMDEQFEDHLDALSLNLTKHQKIIEGIISTTDPRMLDFAKKHFYEKKQFFQENVDYLLSKIKEIDSLLKVNHSGTGAIAKSGNVKFTNQ